MLFIAAYFLLFFPQNVSYGLLTGIALSHLCTLTANHNNCHLLCHLLVILKVIFANIVDPDQTVPLIRVHSLALCKNRFEKFARIFSRQHKKTTFSDAGFLGILRVNLYHSLG